jgi:hypothetical protein
MIHEEMKVFKSFTQKKKSPQARGIHNRLYMDSRISRRSNKKQSDPAPSVQYSQINYGQVMYDQSKEIQKDKWREKANLRNELKTKETKELTFHPSIPGNSFTGSSLSELHLTKPIVRNQFAPLTVRELKECSFKPSVHSTPNLQSTGNIHERLYRQAAVQKKVQKVNVRPQTVKSFEERAETVNRLLNSHLRTQAHVRRIQEKEGLLDPRSLQSEKSEKSEKNDVQSDLGKEDIFHVYRVDCFKKIFQMLDSDLDGLISREKIELGNFEEEFVEIFLKYFMKDLGKPVEVNQFVTIMEHGVCFLNIRDRIVILKRR